LRGALACPEPPAAEIGGRVLSAGGNAFDAAVATAFAQGVANPLGCGIGGQASIALYSAADDVGLFLNAQVACGSAHDLETFVAAGGKRLETVGRYLVEGDTNQMGYRSIMVPGFVAGMGEVFARFGSGAFSWADLVRPAADLATAGVIVYPYLERYYTFEGPDGPGRPDIFRKLAQDPHAAALYLPDGGVPAVGDVLRQPDLAKTLHRIAADGPSALYTGELGREVARDLRERGSGVTRNDFASYTVRTEMPIIARWRDLELLTTPAPTRGAVLLSMLRAVEHYDFRSTAWNTAPYIELLAKSMCRAFADGARLLGDTAYVSVPVERLLTRRRPVGLPTARPRTTGSGPTPGAPGHTTHVTVLDAEGNVASITHSIGSVTGAGVMTPGLGFFYNNFLGHMNPEPGYHNSITPGKRTGGGCPTIVFRGGRPVFAIGSSGGSRLVSAVFQNLVNVFVHGLSPSAAVAAPRFHCEEEGVLHVEPRFPEDTVAELRTRGYHVLPSQYMGCNQTVLSENGRFVVGSDPRGGEGVAVV
jgi:gamma-glutamyltranspeptidase/glutathione hydrolase